VSAQAGKIKDAAKGAKDSAKDATDAATGTLREQTVGRGRSSSRSRCSRR
jgi:hypothetical protein